jgi:hypothetical protein
MKGILLASVVVLGMGVVLLWRSPIDPFHAAPQSGPPASAAASSTSEAKKSPDKNRHKPAVSAQAAPDEPVTEIAVAAEPPAESKPVALKPSKPFPVASQVSLGMNENEVTDAYGSPSASAVTLLNGHTVETLVYARDAEGSATVIRLTDGRVSYAASRTAPRSPQGWLVPERLLSE